MTCGNDCDVRTFVGLEDDDISEFSLSSSKLTALVCYTTPAQLEGGRTDVVAVAVDDNTVQAFTTNVSQLTLIHILQTQIVSRERASDNLKQGHCPAPPLPISLFLSIIGTHA